MRSAIVFIILVQVNTIVKIVKLKTKTMQFCQNSLIYKYLNYFLKKTKNLIKIARVELLLIKNS